MRHGKKFNHLGRKTAHRKAMLSNMASSLIAHKRISTTIAKAKALRLYVEPLLTKSKDDSTHSRRVVFSYLQNKETVSELFRDIAPKIADRPGGYTRILKTGNRLGDNAEMCFIELVDFNDNYASEKKAAKKTRRRKSAGTGEKQQASTTAKIADKVEAVEDAVVVDDEVKAEEVKAEAKPTEVKETPEADSKTEEKDDSADIAEEKKSE